MDRYAFKERKSSECTHSMKWQLHGRETGKWQVSHIPPGQAQEN